MAETIIKPAAAAPEDPLAALESILSALPAGERKLYFFKRKDAESLKLVNLLSCKVDAIRDPAARRQFFLAHPELEVRYSAANFIPSKTQPNT
jgi:hypothetical protein